MSLSLAQKPIRRKTQFSTVIPMTVTGTEQRTTRPRFHVCPECGGTRRLKYVIPDTFEVETMPCLFCDGNGYFTRNPSHAEHRDWLQRLAGLGGMAWSAVKAVLL